MGIIFLKNASLLLLAESQIQTYKKNKPFGGFENNMT